MCPRGLWLDCDRRRGSSAASSAANHRRGSAHFNAPRRPLSPLNNQTHSRTAAGSSASALPRAQAASSREGEANRRSQQLLAC
ncbi:hypothetical protein F2P81_021306 [Scophthalmus maximus]|uniref:Uncharacterized protein n=1 Tax=Scophthalmus maximus TaxID=52904 RepID=A0A6A4S217_SCOMX|nr:hypothetical protein F2P81_021306 [Scophthalmus maximus]